MSKEKEKKTIRAYGVNHQGEKRDSNEDNIYFNGMYLPEFHSAYYVFETWEFDTDSFTTFGVFDGMGGLAAGETASYLAAKNIHERLVEYLEYIKESGEKLVFDEELITKLILYVNGIVASEGLKISEEWIGTTLALCMIYKGKCAFVNVGDSPIYRIRHNHIEKVFTPHTDEEYYKKHNLVGKPGLTQFLGIPEDEYILEPSVRFGKVRSGDYYLTCSDGLSDMVPMELIEQIVNSELILEEKVDALVQTALDNGGYDNITVVLAEVK